MCELIATGRSWVLSLVFLVPSAIPGALLATSIADSFVRPFASATSVSQGVGEYEPTYYCGNHLGQDLPGASNTAVVAIANGVVRYSGYIADAGHSIRIEHTLPDGTKTVSVYFHLKEALAAGDQPHPVVGQEVAKGAIVGYITGVKSDYGTGPHLHLGIRPGPYKPGTDPRTGVGYYPGYSSILVPPPRLCDEFDWRHAAITAEWLSDPIAFIDPHSGTTSITFVARGKVTFLAEDIGLLPGQLPRPFGPGVDFVAEYTFNAIDNLDRDPTPWNGGYTIDSAAVTIGQNAPLTFNRNPLNPGIGFTISVTSSSVVGSPYTYDSYYVDIENFGIVGDGFDPTRRYVMVMGVTPGNVFATDALPTAPPDINQFPDTPQSVGRYQLIYLCPNGIFAPCGQIFGSLTSLVRK